VLDLRAGERVELGGGRREVNDAGQDLVRPREAAMEDDLESPAAQADDLGGLGARRALGAHDLSEQPIDLLVVPMPGEGDEQDAGGAEPAAAARRQERERFLTGALGCSSASSADSRRNRAAALPSTESMTLTATRRPSCRSWARKIRPIPPAATSASTSNRRSRTSPTFIALARA
jgi:hypothetical protein